jgi:hypothetical protein
MVNYSSIIRSVVKLASPKPEKANTREERMNWLISLNYNIYLRVKDDTYYFTIRELALVGTGENMDVSYQNLIDQKLKYFDYIIDFEADNEVTLPRKVENKYETIRQLRIFIYKVSIVCILGLVSISIGGSLVGQKFANISGESLAKKVIKGSLLTVENGIDNYLNQTSDDLKEQSVTKFRRLIEELKPYIDELQKLEPPSSKTSNRGINDDIE